MNYLVGLPAFALYFVLSSALLAAYCAAYTRLTRHDEMALIRAGCTPAAIAYTGSILGFALPLASAVAHSVALLDCLLWGLIALGVQCGVYLGLRRWCMPDISERIERGETAAGTLLAGASLATGLLNAASMSY